MKQINLLNIDYLSVLRALEMAVEDAPTEKEAAVFDNLYNEIKTQGDAQ